MPEDLPIPDTTPSAFNPANAEVNFAAVGTPGLTLFLIQKRRDLPASEYAELVKEIREDFQAHTVALLAVASGPERARVLHARMDDAMQVGANLKVSCQKGCSGCCHHEVEMTGDEADLLVGIVASGLAIDRSKLRRQASRPRKSQAWAVPLSAESRCVFLSAEGACGVYDDRPAVCRKHVVVSPAEACVTIGATTSPLQVPRAEILLSAALAVKGANFTSLSKSLTARLGA